MVGYDTIYIMYIYIYIIYTHVHTIKIVSYNLEWPFSHPITTNRSQLLGRCSTPYGLAGWRLGGESGVSNPGPLVAISMLPEMSFGTFES